VGRNLRTQSSQLRRSLSVRLYQLRYTPQRRLGIPLV
jgi:hypothetical protein